MEVNKIISFLLNTILLNVFLVGQLVHAKNQQKQETSLDAHVHGLSEMTIAIEGEILDIQLISPTVNLFGFEHKAKNQQEVSIVNNAKALLGNTASFLSFSGGDCLLINTAIDVSGLIKQDENAHEHQLKNNKKSHDAHSIQGESHENHSQVVAHYRYRCGNAPELLSIKIKLFVIFQGIQEIHAQWITDKRQGAVTLNADHNIIHLR